jgi:hypothetical protein
MAPWPSVARTLLAHCSWATMVWKAWNSRSGSNGGRVRKRCTRRTSGNLFAGNTPRSQRRRTRVTDESEPVDQMCSSMYQGGRLIESASSHALGGANTPFSTSVRRPNFRIATSKTIGHKYPAAMKTARQLALPLGSTAARRSRTHHHGKAHRPRPRHCHRHPVHVTLRRARCLPSLRAPSFGTPP